MLLICHRDETAVSLSYGGKSHGRAASQVAQATRGLRSGRRGRSISYGSLLGQQWLVAAVRQRWPRKSGDWLWPRRQVGGCNLGEKARERSGRVVEGSERRQSRTVSSWMYGTWWRRTSATGICARPRQRAVALVYCVVAADSGATLLVSGST